MASITARTGKGGRSYQVKWREDGQQRSSTAPTPAAAKRLKALVELHGRIPDLPGADLDAAPTFGEWTAHYLAHLTAVSDRTRDDYEGQAARHLGALTDLPLPALTRDVVREWVLATAPTVSGKTLKNVKGLLSAILSEAVEAGHIDGNPARGVRLPRADDHQRKEPEFLTHEEFWQIADQLPDHWRPYFTLLVGTGLRLGELMALTVGDVDLAAAQPVVRVTKALRYTRGKGFEIGPTKTKRSRRTVALPPLVVADLRPIVARPKSTRLVVQPNGKPIYPTNLYSRVWRPAVEAAQKAGMTKNPRIHDLRHSHASWLIAEGTPLPVIQNRLGHESIKTTSDVYGHLIPDLHIEAAAATQRALDR